MKKILLLLTVVCTSILYSQGDNIHMMNLDYGSYTNLTGTSNNIFEVSENHLIVTQQRQYPIDSLKISHSYDNGLSWSASVGIVYGVVNDVRIKRFSTNKILMTYRLGSYYSSIFSEDDGISWSAPTTIDTLSSANKNSSLLKLNDEIYLVLSESENIFYFKSTDGINWGARTLLFTSSDRIDSHDIVQISSNKLLLITSEYVDGSSKIFSRANSNMNTNWNNRFLIFRNDENLFINNLKTGIDAEGKVWVVYEAGIKLNDKSQSNLFYLLSVDGGLKWGYSNEFTKFVGNDIKHELSLINGNLFVVFQSERYNNGIATTYSPNLFYTWFGKVGSSEDIETPPYVANISSYFDEKDGKLILETKVKVIDDNEIENVYLNNGTTNLLELFDDGNHNDNAPNDSIYGNILENISTTRELNLYYQAEDVDNNITSFYLNTFFYNSFQYDEHNFLMRNYRSTLPISETGIIGDVNNTYSSYDGLSVLYSGGFALTGFSDMNLWGNGVMPSSRIEDYVVGTVGMASGDPKAKLYLLENNKLPFGEQWQIWKDAVELGAKFYDGDGDGVYNPVDINSNGKWDYGEDRPDLLGDQTVWSVLNDGLPSGSRNFHLVSPQGIEIRQTVFTFNSVSDVYFLRYEILNSGKMHPKLNSIYFSFFLDPDLGNAHDDLISTDIANQAVCVYNNGADEYFGEKSPTSYTMLLQGPSIFVPGISFSDNNGNDIFDNGDSPLDSARTHWGELVGYSITPGALNQELVSSNVYFQSAPGLGDPTTQTELRNYMLGLDKLGNKIDACNFQYGAVNGIDCHNVDSRFIFSSDPITQIGWVDSNPADIRYLMNVGPFDLETNETQTIIAALVFARGDNSLESIEKAREKLIEVRAFYKSNFKYEIVGLNDANMIVENFDISQNYPNPFNPSTKMNISVPQRTYLKIEIFDVLGRKIRTLINQEVKAGKIEVTWNGKNNFGNKVASGNYIVMMKANEFMKAIKVNLLK